MKRIPNMRVEVTRSSIPAILNAGGCVSYFGTGNPSTVYAEGQPEHVLSMSQRSDVTVLGEIHKTPNFRNESGAYL
ncbi:hypothetical protein ST201phi2-1p009 [Pseudomonas phage 201phi2-1]|uniref:Uncharacterized protein n=1 Tax=Pseudomonas phage 201phi2-1 TaxID=198110 RepID=B3FJY5_BP201|nr:hypothetical protein ST201phi2-1p009 [Pseudomonas phage 201phi2-1]ABY62843.1 hypothetical protein 201phi2-1p009 [Pseudomonas phage 201phi2-1]